MKIPNNWPNQVIDYNVPLVTLTAFCFLLASNAEIAFSQNQPPSITRLEAEAYPEDSQLIISYDLDDLEGDVSKVTLRVSEDNGETYMVSITGANGDVGYPVWPGNNKLIIWN